MPLPPPLHHPLPPLASKEEKPIFPPLKSLPHHQGVVNRKRVKELIISLVLGTAIALVVAFVLGYFKISINVILPVIAPIWIGSISVIYSVITKN